MSACKEVRQWIGQHVVVPVMQPITESREVCENIGQWVEESITKPVERWISKVEEFCRDLPWPLDWFCEAVTVWVKIVEWVVETVVKWVVTLVCQLVTFVVGFVLEFVTRLVGWFVTFIVCLFSEPLEALKSLLDLWNIVLDAIGDVLDFTGLVINDILGILDDIERLIDSIASSLGWLGVILGILKGIVGLVRQIVEAVRDIVNAAKDILLGLLNLNLCRLLRGLANLGVGIVQGVLASGLAPVGGLLGGVTAAAVLMGIRVIGAAVGGVRDSVQLKQVGDIIEEKIRGAFAGDDARIQRSLQKVNRATRTVGLPFEAEARRMFLSSRARLPDLRALHNSGVINLYSLAGYGSDCGGTFNEPDGEVVYAGTDLRVSFVDISTFLSDGPDAVPEFHVFPITRARFRDHLERSRRKARYLGCQLTYPPIRTLQIVKQEWIPLAANETNDAVQLALLRDFLGRNGVGDDLAVLPALSHFHYVPDKTGKELFGLASWFRPSDDNANPSGVTYRNRSPDLAFRWVLVHEMGHYWGLNHDPGQRGLDEIMYTPKDGIAISGSTVLEYLLLGGEPRFTMRDLRSTWDWITTDGAASLLP